MENNENKSIDDLIREQVSACVELIKKRLLDGSENIENIADQATYADSTLAALIAHLADFRLYHCQFFKIDCGECTKNRRF
ncbi:hypothetical protein [Piscirickettsia litoralis]|uniref:Uncharacterized protein n=1 Tax=Piscirickettsia litoralis TaxID=1891921 RepID=A0ABX2ZY13_9GAMM|nr:hypothetical protein [Piscirickettsia litoralis]ODN41506.1 hypothetical protein BGC07_15470 [Piscirickettsia litoralis]